MKRWLVIALVACTGTNQESADQGPVPEPRAQQATRTEARPEEKPQGYLGVLTSRGLSEVVAPFTTTVVKLEVKLGDQVTRGQRLAQLDERPLREELRIAEALLKANRAAAARANIERKGAAAALDREQKALKENVASKADVETAELNQKKAQMALAAAGATVEEQRARIAQLQARLTDTALLAPLDGKVALLYVRDGDRVEEGRSVLRVISSDELFIKFAIPADKSGTLSPGDEVDVVVPQQGLTTRGIVRHIAPEIDPIAKMILAEADLAESAKLQSGTECRIVPRPHK